MREAVLAFACTMGCASTLPAPATPDLMPPDAVRESGAGQTAMGRVAISTDVPARVETLARIEGSRAGTVASLLCEETPCEAALPYGDYELRFTSLSDPDRTSLTVLGVHDGSVVVRHVLGQRRQSAIGPMVIALGVAALVSAAVTALALQPPTPNPSNGPSGHSPDADNPAPYIALGGLGVLGLGVVLTAVGSSVYQDGATTVSSSRVTSQASFGGSFGFRF